MTIQCVVWSTDPVRRSLTQLNLEVNSIDERNDGFVDESTGTDIILGYVNIAREVSENVESVKVRCETSDGEVTQASPYYTFTVYCAGPNGITWNSNDSRVYSQSSILRCSMKDGCANPVFHWRWLAGPIPQLTVLTDNTHVDIYEKGPELRLTHLSRSGTYVFQCSVTCHCGDQVHVGLVEATVFLGNEVVSENEFDWRDDESHEIESDVTDSQAYATPYERQLTHTGELESDAGYPDIDADTVLPEDELDVGLQEQETLDTLRDEETNRREASSDSGDGGEPDSDILDGDLNELAQRPTEKKKRKRTRKEETGTEDDEIDHQAPPYIRIPGENLDVGQQLNEDEISGGQSTSQGSKQPQETGESDSDDMPSQVHQQKERRHPDTGGNVSHSWGKEKDFEEDNDESRIVLGDQRRRLTEWDVTDSEQVNSPGDVYGREVGAAQEADIVKTDSKLHTYRKRMRRKKGTSEYVDSAGEDDNQTDEQDYRMADSEDTRGSVYSYYDSQSDLRKRAYQKPSKNSDKRNASTTGCRYRCDSEESGKSEDIEKPGRWRNYLKPLSEVPIHPLGVAHTDGLHYSPEIDISHDGLTGSVKMFVKCFQVDNPENGKFRIKRILHRYLSQNKFMLKNLPPHYAFEELIKHCDQLTLRDSVTLPSTSTHPRQVDLPFVVNRPESVGESVHTECIWPITIFILVS